MPLTNAQMAAILAQRGSVSYGGQIITDPTQLPTDLQIAAAFAPAVQPATAIQTMARRLSLAGWKLVGTRNADHGMDGTSSTAGTDTQCSCRCWHSCPQGLSAVRLVYANWGLPPGNTEPGPGNPITVAASLEYPSGNANKQRVYFGGRASAIIDDGGMIVSDPVFVNVPPATGFWTNTFVSTPPLPGTVAVTNASATVTGTGTFFTAALVGQTVSFGSQAGTTYTVSAVASPTSLTLTATYSGVTNAATTAFTPASPKWYWTRQPRASQGEANNAQHAAGSGVDLTAVNAVAPTVNTAAEHLYGPIAILGAAQRSDPVSVVALADSIVGGGGRNLTDAGNVGGWLARAIANFAYLGFGQNSIGAGSFISAPAGWRNRLLLSQSADYVVVQLGINDVPGGSLPPIQAALTALYAAVTNQGSRVIACTTPPWTTSSDSWATVANQAVHAQEAVRTGLNDWIRAKPANVFAVVDIAAPVEVDANSNFVRNGGRWLPGASADGLHPSDAGHTIMANAFPVSLLVPY